jgi:hypothetical protein
VSTDSTIESSDAEGRGIDELTTTSDSGLEQSSSDELELGPRRPVSVMEDVPEANAVGANEVQQTNLHMDNLFYQISWVIFVNATEQFIFKFLRLHQGEVNIPLDDDDDDAEEEDPVERPPEPTVPDERVDDDTNSEERHR